MLEHKYYLIIFPHGIDEDFEVWGVGGGGRGMLFPLSNTVSLGDRE